MQANAANNFDRKLDNIRQEVNMNILRSDHLEKLIDQIVLSNNSARSKLEVPPNNIANPGDQILNSTFDDFKNYTLTMIQAKQKESIAIINTFENLAKDRIGQMRLKVDEIEESMKRNFELIQNWEISEDERSLFFHLRQTVKQIKFSIIGKM